MDSFRESMDSYRFVGHESGLKKICLVSWVTNPDFKRFVSNRDHESSQFSKDSTCFHESNESLRISTMALTNPEVLDSRIRTLRIRIVDSFRKTKNLKRFDSLDQKPQKIRFVRIRVRIPHP